MLGFRGHYLFREANTVSFEEQIMSKDKYSSIFSPRMESIVFIILQFFFFTTYAVLKYSTSLAGECSVTRASFDQSRASENVSRILSKVLP